MVEYGIGNAEGVLYVDNPKNAIVNEVFTYMMDKIGTLQNLWPMQVMSPRCRPDVSDPDGRHGRRLPIRGLSRTWCMDRFKTISDEKFDEAVSKVLNAWFKRFPPPPASRRVRQSIVGDEPVMFAADGSQAMQAAAFGAEGSDSDELTPAPAWHGKRAMLCSASQYPCQPDVGAM